jgi:HEAT repeat protein
MSALLGWLGVQEGERRSASLMTLHSLFMGFSTVLFETAASALFLHDFGAAALPWVYIAAAVLNTVTGVAYSAVRQRVSFGALMAGTVLFLLVSVAGLRGALALTGAPWLSFVLLVFYRVLSILTDLEYWATAARLYNVRQAKRLFGLVGSGEVVARIVGAFSVPFLLHLFGRVDQLILLSALALGGCLAVLLPVLRMMPTEAVPARPSYAPPEATPSVWHHLRVLLESRYLTLILGLAALGVLGKYFVDFAFLEQMNSRYGDVKGLAGFFGVFSGVSQAVSLLTRVFVSGKLLDRYGIATGLLILPATHTVCTLLIVASGTAAAADVVFWLAVLNQGIYKTLKHPLDNPSFKVLYQPMKRDQRLSAQIAVETLVTPVMIGIAGVIMLLFSRGVRFEPVHFAWVMLVTFVAWMVLARLASREYRDALMRALQSRLVDQDALSLSDKPSLALVRDKLGSSEPGDVVFALDLLERFDQKDLPELLLARLEHPSNEVRRYALQRLAVVRPASALGPVRERLREEKDPWVQAAALRCLAALGEHAEDGAVAAYLDHPDVHLRRGAIVGLLRHADAGTHPQAEASLQRLAADPDPEAREVAGKVVGEVGGAPLARVLLPLLRDPVPDVRRAALAASSKVPDRAVWAAVVESLGTPTYCTAAAAALAAAGPPVLDAVRERLETETSRLALYRLAWVCGRVGGAEGIDLLKARMDHESTVVRVHVLESLSRLGWRAEGADAERVLDALRQEAREMAWRSAIQVTFGSGEALQPLRSALDGENEESRRRTLALLSFVADRETVLRASANLGHELKERRAYAMELLDIAVPREMREVVLPVVEELAPQARLDRLGEAFPPGDGGRDVRLRELILHPVRWLRPWTRSCAIWTACRVGLPGLRGLLPAVPDDDRMVQETVAWANGSTGGRGMLTVEKIMILKGVAMFSRTPEEVLDDLAAILEEVQLKKGDVIFRKGDVGDSMYIIVSGSVRVFDGDKTINVLEAKDIFGELALLDPEPRSASVAALEDTHLFRIDRETFSELMAGSISIVRGVLHVLCERLRRIIPMARAFADQAAASGAPPGPDSTTPRPIDPAR